MTIDYIKSSEWDRQLSLLIRTAIRKNRLQISVPYTGTANDYEVFAVAVETEFKRWTIPLTREAMGALCSELEVEYDMDAPLAAQREGLDNLFKQLDSAQLGTAVAHLRPTTAEQVMNRSPEPQQENKELFRKPLPKLTRYHSPADGCRGRRRSQEKLTIANFELLLVLGKGGYGCVYLSRKRDTGEIVALKKMNKEFVTNKNLVDAVQNERSVLVNAAQTKSPWLVRLHYSFHDQKHLWIAMEYVAGGDVRHLLDKVMCLVEADAAFYFAEMVTAVAALHQHGFVHRDLKPDNFLIDSAGHLKLADFGLSKKGAKMTGWTAAGTPNYMAPEIILSETQDDSVDWWALGCILYELLVGIPPFNGETPDEVFEKVAHFEESVEWSMDGVELFSAPWKTLLQSLLCHRSSRIGGGGVADFRATVLSQYIDWDQLRDRKPPFIPKLESEIDASYFTSNIPMVPLTPAPPTPGNQPSAFAGFTFIPPVATPLPMTLPTPRHGSLATPLPAPASPRSTPRRRRTPTLSGMPLQRVRKVLFPSTPSPKRVADTTGITPLFKRQRIDTSEEEDFENFA